MPGRPDNCARSIIQDATLGGFLFSSSALICVKVAAANAGYVSIAAIWPGSRGLRCIPMREDLPMRIFAKVGIAKAGIATAALLSATLFATLVAAADDVPTLDVQPVCHGIAEQAANPTEKGGPDLSYKDCVSSEAEVRVELGKVWSTFQAADQGHCLRLSRTGGLSSYTELLTCLEMARDVRKLHSNNNTKGID